MTRRPRASRRDWLRYLGAVAGAGVAGCAEPVGPGGDEGGDDGDAATAAGGTERPLTGYETTEVAVRTPDGDRLGSVTAAVADTPGTRYRGLSGVGSLPEDRGMLFVFGDVAERTFVMRGMEFGLDIVYADADGVITRIHHAPAPGPNEDGSEQRYPGRGRYVLEVVYGWTTDRGVGTGDVLAFDL
ncbi:MAG: DUF192 domain-containing protein [Haloferacaceae archaeon]